MDGRGCWRDNIFVERRWRSITYEEVSLHAYESVAAAKFRIGRYVTRYNTRRPHSSLDDRTPDAVYFTSRPLAVAAYPHPARRSSYPALFRCTGKRSHFWRQGSGARVIPRVFQNTS